MQFFARLWTVLLVGACGGGSGEPQPDGAPPDPIFSDQSNVVTVSEMTYRGAEPWAYGSASASFSDEAPYLVESMREGSCRLLTSEASYCEDCPDGFCLGDECRAWPVYRQVGRITLTGLQTAITLSWMQGYYGPEQYDLPPDLFSPGAEVTATAPGADLDGFTVTATGVAPIEPELGGSCDSELRLVDGQDAVLSWPDADADARVRLWMPSPNNAHGLPPRAAIECEGTDTGSFTIPAALIGAFPELPEVDTCGGIACVSIDCPPSVLTRYGSGSAAAGSEQVELRVQSQVSFYLVHEAG